MNDAVGVRRAGWGSQPTGMQNASHDAALNPQCLAFLPNRESAGSGGLSMPFSVNSVSLVAYTGGGRYE
jgi:hypothetical protein